jgi:Zn-dependent peptidase ImmA (M78 family)
MTSKKEINKYIKSQKSIQWYPKVQNALRDVLSAMSSEEYNQVTKNLILMVLHEGALGQVMHFPQSKGKFKILQLSIAKKAPISVIRFVIAHELGHVNQGRNWRKSDGISLEHDADAFAKKLGFPKTNKISAWMGKI